MIWGGETGEGEMDEKWNETKWEKISEEKKEWNLRDKMRETDKMRLNDREIDTKD